VKITFILAALILGFATASYADETIIQARFDIRNGTKDFAVQHIQSLNLYVLKMNLRWQNFNPQVNSIGYKFTESKSAQFISPTLPGGCTFNDKQPILGFMNGFDAGGNLLTVVLKGQTCEDLVQELARTNLEIIFYEVTSMSVPQVTVPAVRLQVLELP